MIIHREIRSSYHHKPKVQGVDYSPFIMVMMVEMLEKMETTRQRPAGVFPLQSAAPGLLFRGFVFLRRSLPKAFGGLFL